MGQTKDGVRVGYQYIQPSLHPPTGEKGKYLLQTRTPPPQEARASKQKWFLLFVLLRSSVPPIYVAADMFIRLQHAFKTEYYRHVILKSQVHYEINLCNYLISSLANHPKNSREIISHPPT